MQNQGPYIYAADLNAKELSAWIENQFYLVRSFVNKAAAMESDFHSAAYWGKEVNGSIGQYGLHNVRTSQDSTLPAEVELTQKKIFEFQEFLKNFDVPLKDSQEGC